MVQQHEVLDLVLDVTPDVDRSGRRRHVVPVSNVCVEKSVHDMFIDKENVSLRDLFNYLDGDPRGYEGYDRCMAAGTLLQIASLHRINMLTEGDDVNEEFEDLIELIDEEFDLTLDACVDNMCSYLFGRHTLNFYYRKTNIEAFEDMHEICENLLWTIVLALADEVNEVQDITHITKHDPNLYPVARWDEDVMLITFRSSQVDIAHEAFFHIVNRGVTNDERYYRSHRSRSRHRTLPERSRSSR